MMKTCNMFLIATAVFTIFFLISLLLLCNFSCNSALSRNHDVFKQHRDLTESTYDKLHCLLLFSQRQYKLLVRADWFQENLSTMYTKIYCLFNSLILLSMRNSGQGSWFVSVYVSYDGVSLTQAEMYHGLSSYFFPLILPGCCLGNTFCCIRLCLPFSS